MHSRQPIYAMPLLKVEGGGYHELNTTEKDRILKQGSVLT